MRSSCRAALRFHLVVAYTTAVLALTLPGPAHAQTVQLCSGGSGPPVCDGSCPVDQECVWDGGGVCLCFGLCQPLVQGPPVCDGVGTEACIDPIFGPTASYFYWSATTLARDPGPKYAWNVYFLSGYVNNSFKSWADPVRAVRSGP